MSEIHFDSVRYEKLRRTYDAWWKNELERPLASIITTGHPTAVKPTDVPLLSFMTAWDKSITPQMLTDAYTYHFSQMRFHGDCFPQLNTSRYGPGVLAAFLGCEPIPSEATTWFLPKQKNIPIEQLHFEYNRESPYLRRILDFIECGMERWKGDVTLCMPDLGGVLDVLASFRDTENLLYDLYDNPDEVKRCVKEIQKAWLDCFAHVNTYLAPHAQGYSDWFGLYYDEPGYILQSDFCYMISPDMFREFVGWELESTGNSMKHAIYHLDGVGEIRHLEQLLQIDSIAAIQFGPGAGPYENEYFDEEVLLPTLRAGRKLVCRIQNPDGSPLSSVKDHLPQLYFAPQWFHKDDRTAIDAYADMWNISLSW